VLHAILCLMPALVLASALLARRYPGARTLVALRTKRQIRWPRPRSSTPARRRVVIVAAHGGQLIGRSLAVRPPPALSTAS
jgi:hypothetical protein